jgi:CDP-diacylglycerol---serine O-phosphatidyltransferase
MSTVPLLVMTYVLGFLMVSTLPYYSFKDLEFVKAKPLPVLFAIVVMVSVIAMNPAEMLFALMLIYVLAGPVQYVIQHARGNRNAPAAEVPCPPGEEPARDLANGQSEGADREERGRT